MKISCEVKNCVLSENNSTMENENSSALSFKVEYPYLMTRNSSCGQKYIAKKCTYAQMCIKMFLASATFLKWKYVIFV